jgi:spore coat protein U-like protein
MKYICRLCFAAILVAAGIANATTTTTNLSVTASVNLECILSTTPVAFGIYDSITENATVALTGTGTITTTCTNGAAAKITLSQGANANTGSTDAIPLRRMVNSGTNFLSYTLYSDSGRTVVWGNTVGTGATYTGTGLGTGVTVYGTMPPGQNTPSGAYTDTVVVTITF